MDIVQRRKQLREELQTVIAELNQRTERKGHLEGAIMMLNEQIQEAQVIADQANKEKGKES